MASSIRSFAPWGVVTWIDHQPHTNCEAIASRGWREDPPYGIHDILVGAGFHRVCGSARAWRAARSPA